ncbi:hypothetical protein QFX18_20065 [Saccharophagus degradans]|uniref:hypothetical protein n=1 Tax=Saccharophagus degradans TaxID=86304 RepID=UPI002477E2B0|nr:hypothetical protein [Saccharophagus degradans]WGO98309.1 hypothetical protein QFX18_20065 [Saccharophagus degradans]
MVLDSFDWKTALQQLFAATVNQQTLEEASELMVSVSASDEEYHNECLHVLDEAIRAANSGDDSVMACINKSGYKVSNLNDAAELLRDFRIVYLEEYRQNTE